jgi:acetylornithine deacetylase/succinyl-diaminopimelate desuccinylase-like protein
MMSEVIADLSALSAIPSVAFPGFPSEPVIEAANATLDILRRYGIENAHLLEIPNGYPSVYGEIPGPEGAPTVMLYGHYDVQPAPMEQGWTTDPYKPVQKNGRLYARGAADDKSGILQHAAAIKAMGGTMPVSIKILIEGEEETTSHLEPYVEANPDRFQCDAFLINDLGNTRVGEPEMSISERGDVACVIEVRTLDHPVHSGKFGGAAPDALMTLIKTLASLTDDDGAAAIQEVPRFDWEGADFPDDLYRTSAGVLDGVQYVGRGTLATRLWSSPSVTVLGMDVPSVKDASNILHASARARISMRIASGMDGEQQLAHLMRHLEASVPYGAKATVERVKVGQPFRARTDGPSLEAARAAMTEAFGRESHLIGSGASIPLLNTLEVAVPDAEFILWGAQDVEQARIHGADESVDLAELERCILAQVLFFQSYGRQGSTTRSAT